MKQQEPPAAALMEAYCRGWADRERMFSERITRMAQQGCESVKKGVE